MQPTQTLIRAFILTLMLLLSPAALAGELVSTVNRNQLSTNETLVLTVTYTGRVADSQLDPSVLAPDFDVLSVVPQSRNSVSVINGQTTQESTTSWVITLVPKREGQLRIPAFSVNGVRSQPITVDVENVARTDPSGEPLEVFVIASGDSVYPAQPLIVEIELSAASDVSDLNGTPLLIDNAEVESLGQQNFQRVDNGLARQIVVLKYAVFPQSAGKIVIPIMTYSGIQGQQRSFFNRGGRQVIARSEQLEIVVNEVPAGSSAPWFPADDVSITSSWSSDTSTLRVGEPVTRTITITANGQRATQIPPLKRPTTASIKSYRDQPQLATQADMSGIVGTRIESEAVVPNQPGELTLPELSLSWWNTRSNKWEQATLPSKTLIVTGTALIQTDQSSELSEKHFEGQTDGSSIHANQSQTTLWQGISAAFAFICLLQFWMLKKSRRSAVRSETPGSEPLESERKAWADLKSSLNSRDARSIRASILTWARTHFTDGDDLTLQSLAERSDDPELATELRSLDAMIYRGGADVDVSTLEKALNRLRNKASESQTMSDAAGLKPLYVNK